MKDYLRCKTCAYRNAVPHFNHAMRLLRDNAPTIIEADTESEVQQ